MSSVLGLGEGFGKVHLVVDLSFGVSFCLCLGKGRQAVNFLVGSVGLDLRFSMRFHLSKSSGRLSRALLVNLCMRSNLGQVHLLFDIV